MKKKFFVLCIIILIHISNINCFAFAVDIKYPVKVNTFKEEINFSESKEPQVISFKADSDIAEKLYITVVDTEFELQNGKTIFAETTKNSELEKYLSFEYDSVIDILPGGTDVVITITPQNLPEGIFYKGIKVSHKTDTTISSVLIPVVIKNLIPGKHYSTGLKVTKVGINGDYVVSSPFEVCIELLNTGDSVLSNLTGELVIKNLDGKVIDTYAINDKSMFFAGAPKEIRVPVTADLANGIYMAEASIKYDTRKKDATGSGQFEVRTNMSTAVEKEKQVIIVKNEIPSWIILLIIGISLLVVILMFMLISKRKSTITENKKNYKREKRTLI
jgi:hypothetical protein